MALASGETSTRDFRQAVGSPDFRLAGGGHIAALAHQLRYWQRELIDVVSVVLDRVHPMAARYELSKFLVQVGRLHLAERSREEESPPSPLVAITNQLYVTAATDWQVGLCLLELALGDLFPAERIAAASPSGPASDPLLLDVLRERAGLRACLALLEPLAPAQQQRFEMQAFILYETADLLAAETAHDGAGADAA